MTPYGLSSEERARRLAELHAEPGSDVDAQVAELRQRIAELEEERDALKKGFLIVVDGEWDSVQEYCCRRQKEALRAALEEIADAPFYGTAAQVPALQRIAREALAGRPSETKGEP